MLKIQIRTEEHLRERYRLQVEKYPLLASTVSEDDYVRVNMKYVLRNLREEAKAEIAAQQHAQRIRRKP